MARQEIAKLTAHLKAADIMHRDVVTVEMNASLEDALDAMTANHLTGLPVINSEEKCVGMITATDILNYEQEHSEYASDANDDMAQHYDMDTQRWESVRITSFALEVFAEVKVAEVMSSRLVTVTSETGIREVAKKLIDEKVHRTLVLDARHLIRGIISATDFVRLFANGE